MSTAGNSRRAILAITRAYGQVRRTAALTRRHGWQPLVIPTLRIRPTRRAARRALAMGPPHMDYAVFLSQNGPAALSRAEPRLPDLLSHVTLVAVGPRTGRAVERVLHRHPLVPRTYTSQGIAELLANRPLEGRTILLIRARGAPADLDSMLQARGAHVFRVEAYEASAAVPKSTCRKLREALRSKRVYALICTSRRATHALFQAMPKLLTLLAGVRVVALGPATAAAVEEHGIRAPLQPPAATLQSTLEWLGRQCPSATGRAKLASVRSPLASRR